MTESSAAAHQADIRPVVRTAGPGNAGVWLFGGILLLGGALLFNALEARRESKVHSAPSPAGHPERMISAPPPLALPMDNLEPLEGSGRLIGRSTRPAGSTESQVVTRMVRPVEAPATALSVPEPAPQSGHTPRQPVIFEQSLATSDISVAKDDRVFAGRLRNPSVTVPQGTIIAAVLETALDSTRPGGVRAIVSRDVRSYDGSRVLIPRGSRLYGKYESEMSAGENRAMIRWQRVTRPDAVIIDLDSPAADPLGRAGVRGKVDSHFLERFGGAILQSVLDIGVGIATRSVTDEAVIVGLPGSTQNVVGQQHPQSPVRPTLRVKQGTSVSVFVARDLDFSTVER